MSLTWPTSEQLEEAQLTQLHAVQSQVFPQGTWVAAWLTGWGPHLLAHLNLPWT